MDTQKNYPLGNLLALFDGLDRYDDKAITEVIQSSADVQSIAQALRFKLNNYQLEVAGMRHVKKANVWAVPVLIEESANEFITTSGTLQEVVTPAMRRCVRQLLNDKYEIAAFQGLIHVDMISYMSIKNQKMMFEKVCGVETGHDEVPEFTLPSEISERIGDGTKAELALILGSATQYNRIPDLQLSKDLEQLENFRNVVRGHIAVAAKNGFVPVDKLRVGIPSDLSTALKNGYLMMLEHLARTACVKAVDTNVVDQLTYEMQLTLADAQGGDELRILPMNQALMDLEDMGAVFAAARQFLAIDVGRVAGKCMTFH